MSEAEQTWWGVLVSYALSASSWFAKNKFHVTEVQHPGSDMTGEMSSQAS